MSLPLMPKATALWLIDHTSLTFEQISEFTGLHLLEVRAIADGEIEMGLAPFDPILNDQLTREELDRCAKDPTARLQLKPHESVFDKVRKGGRYTPVSLRKDRPDGIAWVMRHHPEISDAVLCRLLGTTRAMIESIRKKTHKNMQEIKPRHPVILGLCTQRALDEALKTCAPDVEHQIAPTTE